MYEEDLSSYSFKKLEKYQVETEAGIELDKSKCSVKYSMESDGGDGRTNIGYRSTEKKCSDCFQVHSSLLASAVLVRSAAART